MGRALAVLTFEFAGYQGEYKYRLPDAVPLLAEQESFARLLRRATDPDPERRFQSAAEMAEQTTGVLREVLSVADGQPRPAFSRLFSPELRAIGAELTPARGDGGERVRVSPPPVAEAIAGLPAPLADGTDPAAGYLATLGTLPPEQQAAALLAAVAAASSRAAAFRRRWPSRRRQGWRWPGRSSRRATRTAPGSTWPNWPPPIPPTGGSPGTTGCANSQAAGRTRPGRRSAPSTTNCRASPRRSSRSPSPPRRWGRGRGAPLLPARLDDRPVLRQRRVRCGQGLPRPR